MDLHSLYLDSHTLLPFLTILSSFLNSNLIKLLILIQSQLCHIKALFYKIHYNYFQKLEVLQQIVVNNLLLLNKQKNNYVQFEYEQQEEPRIYPPECMRVEKQIGQASSSNLTEEILDYLRSNSKQFEKQCLDIEKQIKDLLENVETEEEIEQIQTRKPYKRN